ncbi:hypothetical protein N7495_009180 [Penicillium taxi]|uniref:uncharacterized protein n=1 Tax=Penicillium taxi TaxID=168475 RepID=UPI002544F4C1|nr:uncharacterized protein N7495_009180 [Penicillium taxi]KAJ5884670.1 hypothetical protein N7495_009180 [Penicillium taxi]
MTVTSILLRRGAELASSHYDKNPDQPKPSPLLVVICVLTTLVLGVAMVAVEYTYGCVVATLAAVEDPNPDIYVRIDNDDPNKTLDSNEGEPVASPGPITNKLRTTISHLRARAGFWSRFRGLGMFMAYNFVSNLIVAIIPGGRGSFFGQFFINSIVGVLLSTWQMAWVHIVITEPSPKRFYQRIPSWRSWIKIAPAAALQDILTAAAFFLPMAVAELTGWIGAGQSTGNQLNDIYRSMAVTFVPALLALMISIPARVIFIRVAASMLPEEDETIVPFDRSFGRKVQPEILGGSGKIGLLVAWSSFDWASRVRFAKVIGKTMAIELALMVAAILVIGSQLFMMSKKVKSPEEQI